MSNAFEVNGIVQRFDRPGGWYFVELPDDPGFDLRGLVNEVWPKLVGATCAMGDTTWRGSIMPIKDGPLFVSLPKPVRTAAAVDVDAEVTITLTLLDL